MLAPASVIGALRRTIGRSAVDRLGYNHDSWVRAVMYQECFRLLSRLDTASMEVLEISGGSRWREIDFKSFTQTSYPGFDICTDQLDRTFDLIIADQIFEHLLWPYRAGKNVYSMLKSNGYFLVSTPFMVRRHDIPVDCSRWTELGLAHFLAECGFGLEQTVTGSWGNAACVRAHLQTQESWLPAAWPWLRSLRNQPAFPVTVWALAQKSGDCA